jgi:hypothetical protein
MDAGDFTTPFMIMAACYLVSTLIYWRVFRPLEMSELAREARPEPTSEVAGD